MEARYKRCWGSDLQGVLLKRKGERENRVYNPKMGKKETENTGIQEKGNLSVEKKGGKTNQCYDGVGQDGGVKAS